MGPCPHNSNHHQCNCSHDAASGYKPVNWNTTRCGVDATEKTNEGGGNTDETEDYVIVDSPDQHDGPEGDSPDQKLGPQHHTQEVQSELWILMWFDDQSEMQQNFVPRECELNQYITTMATDVPFRNPSPSDSMTVHVGGLPLSDPQALQNIGTWIDSHCMMLERHDNSHYILASDDIQTTNECLDQLNINEAVNL
jgi:hypothetical protein